MINGNGKFFEVNFVRTAFVGTAFFSSIISSDIATESPIILSTYLLFGNYMLQDSKYIFLAHTMFFWIFYTHTKTYRYSTFDLSNIFTITPTFPFA